MCSKTEAKVRRCTKRLKKTRITVYRSEGKICGALAKSTKTGHSPYSLNLSWTPVITAWPNKNFLLDMTSSEEPQSGKPFLCNLKVLMTSKLGDSQYSLHSVTFSRIVVSFPFFLLVFLCFLSFLQCALQPLCFENLLDPSVCLAITSNVVQYS